MSRSTKPTRPSGLRPLGRPRPLHVACDEIGLPARVQLPDSEQTIAVDDVDQVWRIAEEWWRETPLARTYYQLHLADGHRLTCFHDEALTPLAPQQGAWFAQEY